MGEEKEASDKKDLIFDEPNSCYFHSCIRLIGFD